MSSHGCVIHIALEMLRGCKILYNPVGLPAVAFYCCFVSFLMHSDVWEFTSLDK